jgi:UDP-N-acetylglucosamine 4,6-dehydratase
MPTAAGGAVSSILITGGAGFFGRAFVARCINQGLYDRICIYSRDEAKHAALLEQYPGEDRLRYFVGDVRDERRLWRALDGVEQVVHAAALKRVEVGEYDPGELAKTNVLGTLNVIEACQLTGVRKLVALSSDKACDPINAYGASKLMMEKLVLAANNARGATGPIFAVTRYGNVAGSTGSVIPVWRRLLAQGEHLLPVTDPEATRFWMHADQAVNLVLNTLETMKGGELVIPTLPAYRLADLCSAMGGQPDLIGLRAGEKLHEAMDAGITSDKAERLTVKQLRSLLQSV